MISIKKQLLTLILALGIASPLCAMDAQQESNSWFGWKSGVGAASLVCAGIVYYVYSSWNTAPKKKLTAKKAVYFAQPTHEQIAQIDAERKSQEAKAAQEAQQKQAHEVNEQKPAQAHDEFQLSQEQIKLFALAEKFTQLSPFEQKTTLADHVNVYAAHPSIDLEDILREYGNIYCTRVKSGDVSLALNKLFAAKNLQSRSVINNNIRKLLGLAYPGI